MKSSSRLLAAAKEFLVTVYDKPTGNRLKFREIHLQGIPKYVGNTIGNAGAILGEDGKLIGSHFNLKFEKESEVIDFLKKDVYAKEGVWDLDTVSITPVLIATRDEKKL